MSTLLRQRADSVVSENGDFLPDLSVLSEEHLAWIQADDVEALRGVDADVLALATPAKTFAPARRAFEIRRPLERAGESKGLSRE